MKKFQPPRRSNDHQIKQMLCAICKTNIGDTANRDLEGVLNDLQSQGGLLIPVDAADVVVITDRLPVLAQMSNRNSDLVKILLDQPECAILIVDALVSGREGLYMVKYADDKDELRAWINMMPCPEIYVQSLGLGDFVMVAPMTAFRQIT